MEAKPVTRNQRRRAYKRAWSRKRGGFEEWTLGGKGRPPLEKQREALMDRARILREEADRIEAEAREL